MDIMSRFGKLHCIYANCVHTFRAPAWVDATAVHKKLTFLDLFVSCMSSPRSGVAREVITDTEKNFGFVERDGGLCTSYICNDFDARIALTLEWKVNAHTRICPGQCINRRETSDLQYLRGVRICLMIQYPQAHLMPFNWKLVRRRTFFAFNMV